MKKLKSIALVLTLSMAFMAGAQNKGDKKIIKDAEKAKTRLLKTDSALESFFDDSAGYVIFPNVGKGGFIIGAASGNGVVYEKGNTVGMANLKKVDVGFQAGGQAVIEVIFFETMNDLEQFKYNSYQLSGDISAVMLKSGVAASAKYKNGVAVFTLPKAGLMAEVAVGGQRIKYHPFTEKNEM